MDLSILYPKVQEFIQDQLGVSIAKLALQKNPFPEIDWLTILNQIEAKTKSREKLPTWFSTKAIIYPSKLSIEQTSSERTAEYKSSLIAGNSLIDLTGGLGVDDYYFAKKINKITHCEINTDLSEIVGHNFKQLGVTNIECIAGDSLTTLQSTTEKWDWMYIDPSRRNDAKGKVFMLKDCLPNVPENLDFYFEKSDAILIKTAPLLDIAAGLSELQNVKTIHIVAIENEVKELLWELHKNYLGDIGIKTINLTKDASNSFDFILNQESTEANYSLPKRYLFEPNSAIMKSGGFNEISEQYRLDKLHKHSHLYTSNELIDFPGRVFEIQHAIPYSKKEIKIHLENSKQNITTRNFPETVELIRKKWKIKEGGNSYCFFTTDMNNDKIVLICTKIK
ncbi:MAG: class I SAM-dependent methyltransferase [Flavobacterium sp.]|nr:class I SAM-dependent methyltransferase [Flavobacterium sp.]